DDADAVSVTSTVNYEDQGHESFETLQHKVIPLAAQQLLVSSSNIAVERLKGGSYNRVIGVTLNTRGLSRKYTLKWVREYLQGLFGKHTTEKYVIRIPRFDSAGMEDDIAVLELAASHLTFPVPRTISFDATDSNALGKAYVIQRRLEGQQVSELWNSLNFAQKCSFARQVTRLSGEIAAVTSPAAGVIFSGHKTGHSSGPVPLKTFSVPPSEGHDTENLDKPLDWPSTPQTSLDFMLSQCERWREYYLSQDMDLDDTWNAFADIARSMHKRGLLPTEDLFQLSHQDLEPYNILITIKNEKTVEITGVLYWDGAVFAPSFMFRSTFWLWSGVDDEDEDENTALGEPETEEGKELKKIFLEGTEPRLLTHAFSSECAVARRFFGLLRDGMFSDSAFDLADILIAEWIELHPEDGIV
ncbi:hypothetical protein BDV95DRAFT_450768, partial [Massariosphaeria phaeospora]